MNIEYDLPVTTRRDYSLRNEEKTIKKPYLECEKDSQSHSSQDKYNSEDLDKGPMVNQDDNISNQREMRNEMEFDVNVDPKLDDNLRKCPTENQGIRNKKKFDIHVGPKFGEDHMNVSIKEIVKFRVEKVKRFNSQSEDENKQMINQSYAETKEINDFKISHDPESEEEESVEDSNIVEILELTFQSEDAEVESDSHHLSFSSPSSSSSRFSSSFSNSVEENEIEGKKKMKMNHGKRKRKKKKKYHKNKKKRHDDRYEDERRDSDY
ncbi:UNVERIFIED_CONTAM: hypothetical protein RMT77_015680 [Armadillidium vulgare]